MGFQEMAVHWIEVKEGKWKMWAAVEQADLARRGTRGGIASGRAVRDGVAGRSKGWIVVSSHDTLAHRTCTATDGI